MNKPQAAREAQSLADEAGETFFVVACDDGYRAIPHYIGRHGCGRVVQIVEPRPDDSVFSRMLALASVVHGGDRACYSIGQDQIRLPHETAFKSPADYRATSLHELTHWTGHESRLCRQYGKRFGDQAHAREELVAEMGAAFLCSHAGVDGQLQHAEYLANWISVIKSDKRAIIVAAGAAQKSADFVLHKSGLVEQAAAA